MSMTYAELTEAFLERANTIEALTAEVERLTRVTQVITATADRDCERLERWLRAERVISASRNATIERLWAQLNEATKVPDAIQAADDRRAMSDPMMRSRPAGGYPGRYHSVDAADIAAQRDSGWTDFHPEDFCHRCGYPNVSWHIASRVWNMVMRGGTPEGWGNWQEIVCIPCFSELAEAHFGARVWRVARDEFGTEVLSLLNSLDFGGVA